MNVSAQIARRDFSAKTLRTLTQRGIELVDALLLPGTGDMPCANAERGYLVIDHGTGKVWTFSMVLAAAQ